MKKLLSISIISFFLFSCNEFEKEPPTETIYVYFNDSLPKTESPYNNFNDKITIDFDISKNYKQKKYRVIWYLWIDGDIADSNLHTWGDYVKPKDLDKYKAKIKRIENEKIPELLKVWKN